MPTTPKMGFQFPTFRQKPFWDTWEAFMASIDSAIWASIENSGLLLEGGGAITLDTGSNALTWTAAFHIYDLVTGGKVTIDPGTLSGVTDGKIAYVSVSRPIIGNQLLTMAAADTLSNDVNKVFIGIRRGTDMILRPQTGYVVPTSSAGEAVFSDIKNNGADGGTAGPTVPMWYPRPLQVEEENPVSDLIELMSWDIIVLSGPGPAVASVAGDVADHFPTDHPIDIVGSTDNDNSGVTERYTISGAVFNGGTGNTDISLNVPAGVSFSASNPDGKIYTGRFRFNVAGKYRISASLSQGVSGGMLARAANVLGTTYAGYGHVVSQTAPVSRNGIGQYIGAGSGSCIEVPLDVVVDADAGDVFEIQEYFDSAASPADHSLGMAKSSSPSGEEVYARVCLRKVG